MSFCSTAASYQPNGVPDETEVERETHHEILMTAFGWASHVAKMFARNLVAVA